MPFAKDIVKTVLSPFLIKIFKTHTYMHDKKKRPRISKRAKRGTRQDLRGEMEVRNDVIIL